MKKQFIRILSGLLCLLLVVGFVPADLLGDLIPEASAAAINFKTWEKDNFNGLFIIRSESDPSLVLTQTGYFNTQLTFQKLGAAGDIRKQMFVFRSSRNSLSTSIKNNTTVYFRSLYDVYRYTIDNGGSYGNMWIESGRADYPSPYPIVVSNDYNAGVPEDATAGNFGWKLNIYSNAIGEGEYAGFMKAGIYENNSAGDNNATPRYICRSGSNAIFQYSDDATHFAYIFQPVSYGIPDARNVNLHTSISETSQYLQADYSFVANSSVVNYNSSNGDWPTAWSLSRLPNGYHAIVSTQHGRYLAISDIGAPTLGNKAVLTGDAWSYPQDAEQWQLVPYYYHGQGFTYLIVNKASGRLLLRSANGNTHICDSYYTANQQCNRWMITYIGNSKYQNTVSNAGYTLQTGYDPRAYANSLTSISYPLNLTTGSGAAYSAYNTLKLNPASTVTGHFFEADISAGNATAEARFKSTSGYVFDTRFLTDGAYNLWKQAISYSDGVIQNTTNAFRSNLLSTGNPPHPFKPVGSSSYSASIQFQFKYDAKMFMKFYGGNYSFNVKIQSTDLKTTYYDSWTANAETYVDFSKLTAGTTYVMTISKASNSDANSHFSIFTNVAPSTTVEIPTDPNGNQILYDVNTTVYQNGNRLVTNGIAEVGPLLEYRVKVTNRSIYNLIVLNFISHAPSVPNEQHGDRNLDVFGFGSNFGFNSSVAVDRNGNSLTLNELSFVVYNAAGTPVATVSNLDNAGLENLLTYIPDGAKGTSYGLPTGWSLEVQGIYYQPTEADYSYSRKLVNFAVGAKLFVPGSNPTYQITSSYTAVHFVNEPFFVQWAGQQMTINSDTFMDMITAAGKHKYEISLGLSKSTISSLILSNNDGSLATSNNVTISGKNITLKYPTAGTYQINIKVNYNGTFAMVPTQVFVYDVSDDTVFVLDYGLPVVLDKNSYTTGSDFNQTYNNPVNGAAFGTTVTVHQITGTEPIRTATGLTVTDDLTTAYANISLDANGNITYTPTSFLNGPDYIYVVFMLERVSKLGVAVADVLLMYKTITILPANVIYYEDTLGNIVYPTYDLTIIGPVKDPGITGNQKLPSVGNLGFDDGSYANSKDVTLSGQSVHKVPVTQEQKTISFTFTGTGFELISRVNAFDAATIIVKVKAPGHNDFDWYPVITSFNPSNDPESICEVYQVPVFRLNEDAYNVHGVYEVEIVGLPMQDYDTEGNPIKGSFKPSYIYVDGIRVYNPLGNSELTENYGAEKDAQFHNIRDLILAGKGALADYTDTVSGFVTGEHHYYVTTDNNWSAAFGGINELGAIGANNEIFVRRNRGNYILVLRVKENAQGTGLLQIGIRDVHEARFDGNGGDNVSTSVSYNTTGGWTPLVTNTYSGTEQYYSIDLSKCPTCDGYKVVVLRVEEGGFASFTNIKHKNLTFGQIGEAAKKIYTEPNFFFNESGQICSKDEEGNVTVLASGKDLFELDMINGIMAQSDANNDLV